jgi:hypothetical protein
MEPDRVHLLKAAALREESRELMIRARLLHRETYIECLQFERLKEELQTSLRTREVEVIPCLFCLLILVSKGTSGQSCPFKWIKAGKGDSGSGL